MSSKKKAKKTEDDWVIGIHPGLVCDIFHVPWEGGGAITVTAERPAVVPAEIGRKLLKTMWKGQPALCRLAPEED